MATAKRSGNKQPADDPALKKASKEAAKEAPQEPQRPALHLRDIRPE